MLLFQNLFFLACVVWDWRRQRRISPERRRVIRTWMAIQSALVAAIVPWLLYGSSRLTAITEGDSPGLWAVFARCLTAFSLGETVPSTLRTLSLPLLFLILLLSVLTFAFKKDGHLALFLCLYIAVPILCVFAVAQLRPLYRERYLNVIAPAFYLSFAWGLLSTREKLPRWKDVALIAGLAFFGLSAAYSLNNLYHRPEYQKSPDWRALAGYLASETKPGDVIILNYPDPTFSYYYRGQAPTAILPRGLLSESEKVETARDLRDFAENYQRIWFHPLTDVRWDNEGFVQRWLYHHCQLLESRDFRGFRWLIYRPALSSLEDARHPLDLHLGDAIRLAGYDTEIPQLGREEPVHVPPGSALRFTLYWQATSDIEAVYAVFVHLVDDRGKIYAQEDSPPRGGDFPTDEWMSGDVILDPYSLVLPRDTPPGEYSLVVGMYDPATAARLPVVDSALRQLGDQVAIARVSIDQ
jgi:hypothetical protein